MKKFILRTLVFLLPFAFYFLFSALVLPEILEKLHGPGTREQILTSLENATTTDYDLLILGNSRMYRGVNPDMFSRQSFNFAHDNDGFNQIYYKLRLLREKNSCDFRVLIIGIDYYQFGLFSDTRNYVYGDILGEEYLADYDGKCYTISYYLDLASPKKYKRLLYSNKARLKDNGQYIRPGKPDFNEFYSGSTARLKLQEEYFRRIIDYSAGEGLIVFIVIPPIKKQEYDSLDREETEEFIGYIKTVISGKAFLLDLSVNHDFADQDFVGLNHLNEAAADVFSGLLSSIIEQYISNPTSGNQLLTSLLPD
jgi:hypothetical protein